MYRSAVLNRSKITQSYPRNDPCNSNIYSDGWNNSLACGGEYWMNIMQNLKKPRSFQKIGLKLNFFRNQWTNAKNGQVYRLCVTTK